MDTLTDRYVWAVARRLPHARRAEVGEQLRADIGAAIATRVAAGEEPDAAETAVIEALGDPDRRAADAEGRLGYLIGPRWYFDYRRLLVVVLSAVGPSVLGALLLAQALAGLNVWQGIPAAFGVAFSVTVQVGFWITVAFAVIERVSKGRRRPSADWDLSDLPLIPTARIGLGETIVAVLAYLLLVGLVVWQRNIWVVETAGDVPLPVLDPALWSFWIPWFLALAALEIVFALVAFTIGHWTWALAWVNVALNLAFAVPAVWLIASGAALSSEFRRTFAEVSALIDGLVAIVPLVIVVVAAIDIIEGFRKAYRGSHPART